MITDRFLNQQRKLLKPYEEGSTDLSADRRQENGIFIIYQNSENRDYIIRYKHDADSKIAYFKMKAVPQVGTAYFSVELK